MPIEPCVLSKIGELARNCILEDNRCVFQLGNWAILYYNVGEVHLHILKEGDVPVNVEARWQPGRTDITMRGLYLNGAQVKVATKHTRTILRSDGPAIQGAGDLDELHLPTEEVDFPGEESFIYASKLVDADGISLLVRSEASFILPPRGTFALIETLCGQLQRISSSAKGIINFFLQTEDHQPETTPNLSENLKSDHEHLELIAEHWNGVSEIELLDYRKEVLRCLQDPQATGIVGRAGPPSLDSHLVFFRDERYLKYWQEGLQVMNEFICRNSNDSHSHTHISVRGNIKFLLGEFENALRDLDLSLKMGGHRSTVLLDRALVKCMLGRYSEAMQDVAVTTLSPNVNGIQELQARIQQILDLQSAFPIINQSGPLCQQFLLPDQDNSVVEIGNKAKTDLRESIPANNKPQTPPRTPPRSSWWSPSPRKYYGVRFRPDLRSWVAEICVAEIRVAEWKAVDKKVWLGTFDTEQAAARAVDLARKLLKCKKKRALNLPCEKLEAYSRQIPPQLVLADLTDTSMFKQVAHFVKRECRDYVASFDDTPSEQIIPAFDQRDSFGGQFFNPTSSVDPATHWCENMPSFNSSDVLNVDVHSESDFPDMVLEPYVGCLEESPAGARWNIQIK